MNDSAKKKTDGHTSQFSEITGGYARWTLDCVIDSAVLISEDYAKRYRQYRAVLEDTSSLLMDFRIRTGSDPQWPNSVQRAAILTPFLGTSDGKPGSDRGTPFQEIASGLRMAAIAYSERVYDTGEPMLRQAFIDTARHFRAYLSTLSGSVIQAARTQTELMFNRATKVLSTEGVTHAFGLPPAPAGSWPLPVDFKGADFLDGNGAYFIEEVYRVLQPPGVSFKQQQFLVLQRVAVAGARTMDGILRDHHEKDEDAVRDLIGHAYTWSTAVRHLAGGRIA